MHNADCFRHSAAARIKPGKHLRKPTPAAEQVNEYDHQYHHKQQVNRAAADSAEKAKEPEDQQNNENCVQHKFISPRIRPEPW